MINTHVFFSTRAGAVSSACLALLLTACGAEDPNPQSGTGGTGGSGAGPTTASTGGSTRSCCRRRASVRRLHTSHWYLLAPVKLSASVWMNLCSEWARWAMPFTCSGYGEWIQWIR